MNIAVIKVGTKTKCIPGLNGGACWHVELSIAEQCNCGRWGAVAFYSLLFLLAKQCLEMCGFYSSSAVVGRNTTETEFWCQTNKENCPFHIICITCSYVINPFFFFYLKLFTLQAVQAIFNFTFVSLSAAVLKNHYHRMESFPWWHTLTAWFFCKQKFPMLWTTCNSRWFITHFNEAHSYVEYPVAYFLENSSSGNAFFHWALSQCKIKFYWFTMTVTGLEHGPFFSGVV